MGSHRGEEERAAASQWGIERSVPKDEWRTEGGREGVRVVRVSLFIVFICPPSSPSSVSPSAPGVCVADKRERRRRRRRQGADMMLSVWAVCPAGPGTRSKGP